MSLAAKTDYVAEGIGYLRDAFAGRPNINALMTAFLQHTQLMENAAQQLLALYDVNAASAATLDGIGSLVGAQRNGLDDASFRLFILGQIVANTGDATLATILQLAKQLFQASGVWAKTTQSAPLNGSQGAFLLLCVDAPQLPTRLWPLALSLISSNVGAGVQLAQINQSSSQTPFAFAGNQASLSGFGSVYDTQAGGSLASVISSSAS